MKNNKSIIEYLRLNCMERYHLLSAKAKSFFTSRQKPAQSTIYRILYLVVFSYLCFSCTEIIDLELNKGDNLKIVVDAWLDNSGREQVIKLSLSTDFFDAETPSVATGAAVTVSSERKTYPFIEKEPGRYVMDGIFDAQVGEIFTLEIVYNGELYTATQQMNRIAELENVNYVLYEEFEEEDFNELTNPERLDEWDIYVTFQEPKGVGDYYYFGNYNKRTGPETNLYLGEYYSDELLDGAFIDDEYATYGFYEPGDTIVTEMFSISEDVHDYLFAVDNQTDFRGFIFDAPPANVPTNISNDGKGFFIVSGVSLFEKVLE